MLDILKAISVASVLAFLLIITQLPGYLVFAYVLLALCTLTVYAQGMLNRKETYQREKANIEKLMAPFQQQHNDSLNHHLIMTDAIEELKTYTIENKQHFEKACLKLESHTAQIADTLEQKMQKFVAALEAVNERQLQKQTENLAKTNERFLVMSQSLSNELALHSQASCDKQASHLEQTIVQLQPVVEAVEAMREHTRKITKTFEASSAELQTTIGQHTVALGAIVDKTMKELVEVSDDNAQEVQDKIARLVNELQDVMRNSQKAQNRTLDSLRDDIQTMVNSQQQTQEQSHKTLTCLEAFKDELTALNQKDLHLLESILHG
ncbi:hypothetical protein [Endozoicomonas sp.]|uniref:hypothetical protein n=1 Tax=Endozoicomonas sp. TaxID=1892382 RepID=UPI00383B3A12